MSEIFEFPKNTKIDKFVKIFDKMSKFVNAKWKTAEKLENIEKRLGIFGKKV